LPFAPGKAACAGVTNTKSAISRARNASGPMNRPQALDRDVDVKLLLPARQGESYSR
jgi:hypothetical protein